MSPFLLPQKWENEQDISNQRTSCLGHSDWFSEGHVPQARVVSQGPVQKMQPYARWSNGRNCIGGTSYNGLKALSWQTKEGKQRNSEISNSRKMLPLLRLEAQRRRWCQLPELKNWYCQVEVKSLRRLLHGGWDHKSRAITARTDREEEPQPLETPPEAWRRGWEYLGVPIPLPSIIPPVPLSCWTHLEGSEHGRWEKQSGRDWIWVQMDAYLTH